MPKIHWREHLSSVVIAHMDMVAQIAQVVLSFFTPIRHKLAGY